MMNAEYRKATMKIVMTTAWAFVRNNGMTLGEAMKCAFRNFKLKVAMRTGKAVKFVYRKVDGTIREALGTLAEAAINYIPNGNGKPAPDTNQRYWDLDVGAWRQFRTANLIAVCL